MKLNLFVILGLFSLSVSGSVSQSKDGKTKGNSDKNKQVSQEIIEKKDSLVSEFDKEAEGVILILKDFSKKQQYKKWLESVERQKIKDYIAKVNNELTKRNQMVRYTEPMVESFQTEYPKVVLGTGEILERDSLCIKHKFLSTKCKEWAYFYAIKGQHNKQQ